MLHQRVCTQKHRYSHIRKHIGIRFNLQRRNGDTNPHFAINLQSISCDAMKL